MAVLVRTWLGLAALGAALVHLGAAAGLPGATLVVVAVLSVPELVWGVVALGAARLPVPRLGIAALAAPTVGWVAVLLAGGGHTAEHAAGGAGSMHLPVGALLAGSLLGLAAAVGLAVLLRRGGAAAQSAPPRTWVYLGGVAAGSGVVMAVASVALGSTPIGASAMQGMGH